MAVIPPHPWFLPPFNNHSPLGGKFIAVASALNLGHVIHHGCTAKLRLLLCSHSLEGHHSDLNRVQDICHPNRYLLKRYFLFETLADAFSASCSSFFLFFSGNESEGRYLDKRRSQFKPSDGNYFPGRLWTNVLLALNVLVYAAQIASQGKLTLWGAKVNALIDKGQLWRLVTSSFLHANIGHLMVNCYSLNSIGPTVEQMSGPRRFLAVYFTSAIASSLMSYRFCLSPAVGASGAIFGLVGAFSVFVLRHRRLLGGGKQDLQEIGRVIALNMVIGLLSKGIDNWGHLGGLLGGAAMSWFLGPAWEYKHGKGPVVVDRAPIFRFINRNSLR